MITKEQQKYILDTLKPYSPAKVGIFGSYAKNKNTVDSDLDLLVQLRERVNLFELIELEEQLSKILGIKVDLITEKALNKYIKPHIEKEITYILNDSKR